MPSLVVIELQIKEKQGGEGTVCPPAYMVPKDPSLNRVKTDHQALHKIQDVKDTFGRIATMLRDICEFDFTIMFVRGVDNKMADASDI